ncbi:MAG: glycosyltransferase family 2 protein [Candidatus Hydrogenedentes bacterium]|nr:glycosyltransferase family 2 protein [Candidatus Hydrogenedentota bacterium]
MKTGVSIVVPCYNEADTIPVLLDAIAGAFQGLEQYDLEVIIVDDGSMDNTEAVLRDAQTRFGALRPISMARNSGQSAALVAGMRAAHGEFILTMDGDMQNDPADFPRALELLQDYDCVCGYREKRQDSPLRLFSSRVANAVRNAILHDGIRDSGCGLKGFRRECVDHIVPFNGVHRFLAVFMRRGGFSIVEMPVRHHARRYGVSKYGLNNRLWRGIYDLAGVSWLRKRYVVPATLPFGKHTSGEPHA